MLKDYNRFVDDVRARGGDIVGVCSQTQVEADKAKNKLGVNFRLLGDPTCEIAKFLNAKGWIKSVIESGSEKLALGERMLGYRYTTGMLQPGVVALQGPTDDENVPSVLMTWGSVPTAENINGAVGRLKAKLAWKIIQKSLMGDFSESHPAVVQKGHRIMPFPLPIFYGIVLANGNFYSLKPMVADGDGNFDKSKPVKALAKLASAVGLSIFCVASFPIAGIGLLSLYATYVFRVIRPQIKGRYAPE